MDVPSIQINTLGIKIPHYSDQGSAPAFLDQLLALGEEKIIEIANTTYIKLDEIINNPEASPYIRKMLEKMNNRIRSEYEAGDLKELANILAITLIIIPFIVERSNLLLKILTQDINFSNAHMGEFLINDEFTMEHVVWIAHNIYENQENLQDIFEKQLSLLLASAHVDGYKDAEKDIILICLGNKYFATIFRLLKISDVIYRLMFYQRLEDYAKTLDRDQFEELTQEMIDVEGIEDKTKIHYTTRLFLAYNYNENLDPEQWQIFKDFILDYVKQYSSTFDLDDHFGDVAEVSFMTRGFTDEQKREVLEEIRAVDPDLAAQLGI